MHQTVNIVDRSAFTSSPHNQHMSPPRVKQRLCRPISSEVHAGSDARNVLLQGLAIPYQNSSTQCVDSLPSEFHQRKPLTVSAKGSVLRTKLSQYLWKASYESLLAWGIEQFSQIHRHLAVLRHQTSFRLPFATFLPIPFAHRFRFGLLKTSISSLGGLGQMFFLIFSYGFGECWCLGFCMVFGSFWVQAPGFSCRKKLLAFSVWRVGIFRVFRRQVFKCLFVSFRFEDCPCSDLDRHHEEIWANWRVQNLTLFSINIIFVNPI